MNRFLAIIGVLALAGCDDASLDGGASPSTAATQLGSSLDWGTDAALHRAGSCEGLAAGLRGAAHTWTTLQVERARRHVEALGVALEPTPEPQAELSPRLYVDGRATEPSQRRSQVPVHAGVVVAITDMGLSFVSTLPAAAPGGEVPVDLPAQGPDSAVQADIQELAFFATDGSPWTVHPSSLGATLWVVSRGEQDGTPWTTLTHLDIERVGEGGDPRVITQERVDGRLRLVSLGDSGWRIVTDGALALDGTSAWPQELSPHADATKRAAAFDQLDATNAAAIASMTVHDMVPPSLVTDCSQARYPEHYTSAGWTLVTDSGADAGELQKRLIVGRYTAIASRGDELTLASSNWPYFWFDAEAPLMSAVHRLRLPAGEGDTSASAKVEGATFASGGVAYHGDTIVVASTKGQEFLGANFKPQGATALVAFDQGMRVASTIDDASAGEAVGKIIHGTGFAAVVPDAPTAPLRLLGVDAQGSLKAGGSLASLSTWDTVLPLSDKRLLVVGRPAEAGSMAVRIAVYGLTDVAKPQLVGQHTVAKGGASEVSVDAEGVARYAEGSPDNGSSGYLGIPVQVTEQPDVNGYWELEPRLAMFELTPEGDLLDLGEVSHGPLAKRDLVPLTCGANANERRVLGGAVVQGVLYSVSTLGVLAHSLDALGDAPLGDALLSTAATCPVEQ